MIPGAVLAYVTPGSMQGDHRTDLGALGGQLSYMGLADLVPGLHRRIGPEPGFV